MKKLWNNKIEKWTIICVDVRNGGGGGMWRKKKTNIYENEKFMHKSEMHFNFISRQIARFLKSIFRWKKKKKPRSYIDWIAFSSFYSPQYRVHILHMYDKVFVKKLAAEKFRMQNMQMTRGWETILDIRSITENGVHHSHFHHFRLYKTKPNARAHASFPQSLNSIYLFGFSIFFLLQNRYKTGKMHKYVGCRKNPP